VQDRIKGYITGDTSFISLTQDALSQIKEECLCLSFEIQESPPENLSPYECSFKEHAFQIYVQKVT